MNENRLIDCFRITGELEVITGLHIGASTDSMEIAGNDNPILRNPATSEPYIPGSSLKGKMRSLMEWSLGELPTEGNVTKPVKNGKVAAVFGKPAEKSIEENSIIGPTRLIVRDCYLTEEWKEQFKKTVLSESKTENSINRLTGMANPRPMERVIPGVKFDIEILFRVFSIDGDGGERDKKMFNNVLLPAMALLEADALGGGGSRGNGKVRFLNLKNNGQELTLPSLDKAFRKHDE